MPEDAPDASALDHGDVPVCTGCGLASVELLAEPNRGVCRECWDRRERRCGGGPLRVVTPAMTYHETPLCPGVQAASEWCYWRDEDVMYEDLGGRMDKCVRCHSFRTFGFDHYSGEDQAVIGHA